jgi:hypothetical protein
MRTALCACLLLLCCPSAAHAQQDTRAEAAFALFNNTCLALRADGAAIVALLESDGWRVANIADLPETPPPRRRSSRVGVSIDGAQDGSVFYFPDEPPWLYVRLSPPQSDPPSCAVSAVGVSAQALSEVMFQGPRFTERRRDFVRAPVAFSRPGGVAYAVMVAPIALTRPHADEGTFAFFQTSGDDGEWSLER